MGMKRREEKLFTNIEYEEELRNLFVITQDAIVVSKEWIHAQEDFVVEKMMNENLRCYNQVNNSNIHKEITTNMFKDSDFYTTYDECPYRRKLIHIINKIKSFQQKQVVERNEKGQFVRKKQKIDRNFLNLMLLFKRTKKEYLDTFKWNKLINPRLIIPTLITKNNEKPNVSYQDMITQALEESKSKKLELQEIYEWIQDKYPYFKTGSTCWKNSVRHNLSLNDCFLKIEKPFKTRGKGGYWALKSDPPAGLTFDGYEVKITDPDRLFGKEIMDRVKLHRR